MANIEANYINRKELAKQLGEQLRGRPYSVNTLMLWEKDGRGPPATRIGRDVVYAVDAVQRWLRSQEKPK